MKRIMLTKAEYRVAYALCWDGASNTEIGDRINIAEDTVKSHMKSILWKSQLRDRTKFVAAVYNGRIIVYPMVPRPVDLLTDMNNHRNPPPEPVSLASLCCEGEKLFRVSCLTRCPSFPPT